MWEFLAGLAAGIFGTAASLYLEPVQRRIGKMGRRSFRDPGVQIHVESEAQLIWAGGPDWVPFFSFLPGRLPAYGPPKDPRRWPNWTHEQGGWDLGKSEVQLTIVGQAPVTVIVETPQVVARRAPLPEGVKLGHAPGGASIVPRAFHVSLDAFGPTNHWIELVQDGGAPSPGGLSWSLQAGEVERFFIQVTASDPELFYWRARVPLLVDGRREFIEVNDGGQEYVFAGGDVSDWNAWDGARWSPV